MDEDASVCSKANAKIPRLKATPVTANAQVQLVRSRSQFWDDRQTGSYHVTLGGSAQSSEGIGCAQSATAWQLCQTEEALVIKYEQPMFDLTELDSWFMPAVVALNTPSSSLNPFPVRNS